MLEELFTYPFLIKIFNKILNDNDKILIISLNKFFNYKRIKFTYDKQINVRLYNDEQFYKLSFDKQIDTFWLRNRFIKNEWFYDRLTNVLVDELYPLSSSVTRLTFGFSFNQKITNYIPNSITHLTFGFCFNETIKYCIPNSVIYLTFGYKFNQFINYSIPNSVEYLEFGFDFDQKIQNCIPNSVKCLIFNNLISEENIKWIPKFVDKLIIRYIFLFPREIIELLLDDFFIETNYNNEICFQRK